MNNKPTHKLVELISKQLDPMDSTPLNVYEIRNYIYYGFSDEKLRPKYWKVLLNYYNENKFKSEKYYRNARENYHKIEEPENCIDLIDKDLQRTAALFKDHRLKNFQPPIKRILIRFAVTNASIGYVQGMIQIVIPIYYVLSSSDVLEEQKYAEEDSFYLFHYLMSEINSCYTNLLDQSSIGINGRISNIFEIISQKDPVLYKYIQQNEKEQSSFIMKWILQLFTTVFELNELCWVWDKIFSDAYRFEIVDYFCATIIMLNREKFIKMEFGECMEYFQNIKKVDPQETFLIADELRRSSNDFITVKKGIKKV
ncbi:Tbc1d13 [Nucleospora cyclopteri]